MNPYDENNMYKAYLRAVKGSRWKGSSQRYMNDFLGQNALLGEQIRTGTYRSDLTSEFMICERGKTRAIAGNTVRDRVVRHALCDNVLMPAIQPKIIAANCASQTGKGTGYARKTIKEHLHDYYRHYGNKGYILLIDYTKYYDNIHHDIAYEQLAKLGIPYADAKSEFDSWMGTYRKTMSKIQIRNMKQLFDSLWRGKENGDSNDCIK